MLFKLKRMCGGSVKKNVWLKNYSTIKIGGRAKYVCYPKTKTDLINLIEYCNKKNMPYFVLGAGSNVLISSGGFKGLIIKLDNFNEIWEYDNYIQVGSGVLLNKVVNYYVSNGYSGFEQAIGIPGQIGGATVMNAGAYNFEIKNVVIGVTVLHNGKVEYLTNTECKFNYRTSVFNSDYIILSADFKKEIGNKEELNQVMLNTIKLRSRLPSKPSLGSVFKRNNNIIVSELIDKLGLKGKKRGGAMVSLEHAGVIVNNNNATSEDVKNLIIDIKTIVKAKTGYTLMEEIRYLN